MADKNRKPRSEESEKNEERSKQKPKPDDERILGKLEEIREALVVRTSDDLTDLLRSSRSMRRVMMTNFMLGLSRGVGFFIGMSFLGAVVLGLLAFLGNQAISKIGGSKVESELSEISGEIKGFFQSMQRWSQRDQPPGEGPPEARTSEQPSSEPEPDPESEQSTKEPPGPG